MGFTSGFTGGVTLTLGIAYLTVLAHERNRRAQAFELRTQSRVLQNLLEPTLIPKPQTREELAREERSTIVEAAKDRWNAEIENAIRWVQRTDWGEVREGMEGAVSRLLGTGLQKSREGIEGAEKNAVPKVQEAIDRSKAAAHQAADKIGAQAKEKAHEAGVKAAEVRDAASAKASRTVADVKSGAQEAAKHSGGTVDAARGALRDAVGKGIEMGKEAVGKAQAAIGLATEKLESQGQAAALSHSSAVDKAFHERYEQPKPLPSLEEALEERYTPVDKRDNTKLRGV